MEEPAEHTRIVRFGVFEVDLEAGELRKSGLKIRLQKQPFQILIMLLERPGRVVTREELQKRLWAGDTFVDFEHGIATALKKVREALGDSADNPRFIETLPRRGYRFIAPVALVSPPATGTAVADRRYRPTPRWLVALGTFVVVATLALLLALNVAGLRDRILGTTPTAKIQSIAVLPLENLSGDPEQEYFADAMTDALISNLGKIKALKVISRTSVMQYKGARKQLPEIGRELKVDGVVEGAVLRSGDRVRINVQLIAAATDRHLWAESYERDLGDIMRLQSEVAQDIAHKIKVALTPEERVRLASAPPVKPEAHEAYLKGLYYLGASSEGAWEKSVRYLEQAIEKDPGYAPAYASLADAYFRVTDFNYLSDKEAWTRMKAAAMKAVELDSTLAEPHLFLAIQRRNDDYDWQGAEREYRQALELSPNHVGAHHEYAEHLSKIGRPDEAITEVRRAQELDPVSYETGQYDFSYYMIRDYDRSIAQARRRLAQDPSGGLFGRWILGLALAERGEFEEAIEQLQAGMQHTPETPFAAFGLAYVYAAAGRRKDALRLLGELEARRARGGYVSAYDIAVAYAGLGDSDQAFQWLDKAYEERAGGLPWVKADPRLDTLHSDPRFQDLLRRMNFPE